MASRLISANWLSAESDADDQDRDEDEAPDHPQPRAGRARERPVSQALVGAHARAPITEAVHEEGDQIATSIVIAAEISSPWSSQKRLAPCASGRRRSSKIAGRSRHETASVIVAKIPQP